MPYILDSSSNVTGVTVYDYYVRKYGRPDHRVSRTFSRLSAVCNASWSRYGVEGAELYLDPSNKLNRIARSLGLTLNSQRRIVDSTDSHRLVHWAHSFGKQNELVERLFVRLRPSARPASGLLPSSVHRCVFHWHGCNARLNGPSICAGCVL
jgi:hypothetical protein